MNKIGGWFCDDDRCLRWTIFTFSVIVYVGNTKTIDEYFRGIGKTMFLFGLEEGEKEEQPLRACPRCAASGSGSVGAAGAGGAG